MKLVGINALPVLSAALVAGVCGVAAPLEVQAQDDEFAGLAIEEIVVTARKREENLQEIPLAVTAITSTMVEQMNLQNLDDIAKVTAGMVFDPEFSRTSNRPVIRGQANILGDSGVSYFIDGIYITGSINDYDINDIERIEVVKGPQSALYGRNTYSGAINIVTKSPGDEWAARAQVKFTDDSQQEVSATVKGPLGDSFAIGVTGRYYSTDGFWTNAYDGSDIGEQESSSLSAVAILDPNDFFRARLRVYYNESRDGQPPLFGQPASANNCFPDTGSSLYNGLGRYYCGTLQPQAINTDYTFQVPDARDDNDTLQASLALDFDFTDRVSLTSITGFNSVDTAFVVDGDYSPDSFALANFTPRGFPAFNTDFSDFGDPFQPPPWIYAWVPQPVDFTFAGEDTVEDVSQEFRLNIEGERSRFLIGAYYFDQDTDTRDARVLPEGAQAIMTQRFNDEQARLNTLCGFNPVCATQTAFGSPIGMIPFGSPVIAVPQSSATSNITNTALFGMAAFDLTDATTLTLEGRWANEEIERVTTINDSETAPEDIETVPANADFKSFNPRVTLDHRISDDNMIYALVAKGNKPGGFNSATAIQAGLPSFDEEEVVSVEFGSKNVALDGQLVANFALFFNQIEGYQLTQNARAGASTTSATVNAGDAEIFGAELEFNYRPERIQGLSLMMNYAFTDTEFVKGEDENWGLLLDVADNGEADCSTGDQFPNESDCTSKYGSIIGKRIPRTAEHQVFVDGELRRPMGSSGDWEWFGGLSYSYESSKFAQVANLAETGSASVVNARLGFSSSRYLISVWGKNLTGEDSTPLVLRYADGSDSFKRSFVGTQRRDTYWGLTASVRFD